MKQGGFGYLCVHLLAYLHEIRKVRTCIHAYTRLPSHEHHPQIREHTSFADLFMLPLRPSFLFEGAPVPKYFIRSTLGKILLPKPTFQAHFELFLL
jgi:hypothetical protein